MVESTSDPYAVLHVQGTLPSPPVCLEPFQRFRARFSPIWVVAFVTYVLVTNVVEPPVRMSGPGLSYRVVPGLVALNAGLSLLGACAAAGIVVWLYPVSINASGIQGHTAWGRRQFVPWDHIGRLQTSRILGLRYLRIYSGVHHSPLCMPLFLGHTAEFWQQVALFVAPGNALAGFASALPGNGRTPERLRPGNSF